MGLKFIQSDFGAYIINTIKEKGNHSLTSWKGYLHSPGQEVAHLAD